MNIIILYEEITPGQDSRQMAGWNKKQSKIEAN